MVEKISGQAQIIIKKTKTKQKHQVGRTASAAMSLCSRKRGMQADWTGVI